MDEVPSYSDIPLQQSCVTTQLRNNKVAFAHLLSQLGDGSYLEDTSTEGDDMRRIVLITLLALLFAAASTSAFDGMRKGFVLGGGLGLTLTADREFDGPGNPVSEDGSGMGINLFLGYAWDEQNMIVYEGNACAWDSDQLNETVAQGFDGVSWYHYFGPVGKSFFSVGGLGVYGFQTDNIDADAKFAFMLGGGYEFTRHVQVGAYLSTGSAKFRGDDWDHTHFNVLVSATAF
jgi:hypothetical protein